MVVLLRGVVVAEVQVHARELVMPFPIVRLGSESPVVQLDGSLVMAAEDHTLGKEAEPLGVFGSPIQKPRAEGDGLVREPGQESAVSEIAERVQIIRGLVGNRFAHADGLRPNLPLFEDLREARHGLDGIGLKSVGALKNGCRSCQITQAPTHTPVGDEVGVVGLLLRRDLVIRGRLLFVSEPFADLAHEPRSIRMPRDALYDPLAGLQGLEVLARVHLCDGKMEVFLGNEFAE